MKQYCRYCGHCGLIDEDYCGCHIKQKTFEGKKARRINKCKHFSFNEIDVFDLNKTYKPRINKLKQGKQISFIEKNNIDFDYICDDALDK